MKKCEQCGKVFAAEQNFCDVCGVALVEVPEEPVVEVAPTEGPVAESPVAEAPVAEAPAAESSQPSAESKPAAPVREKKGLKEFLAKNKTLLIIAAAVVVAVIAFICIISSAKKPNGYASLNRDAVESGMIDDNKLIIFNGYGKKKEIETTANDFKMITNSADHSSRVVKDDEGNAYFLSINGLQLFEDKIYNCWVSASGDTVAYMKNVNGGLGELYLYTVKTKKSVLIYENVSSSSVILSEDGKTVAFIAIADNDSSNAKAYYSKNGKEPVLIAKQAIPVAISNGAKYVYYYKKTDSGDRNLYLLKGKDTEKILNDVTYHSFYFNADLSEVLYSDDGKTFVSVKGKDAIKLNSNSLDYVVSGADDSGSYTLCSDFSYCARVNVKTFKGAVIKAGSSYYYIKSFSNVVKVVDGSNVSNLTFSADKKSLVYIKNHKLYKIANVAKPDSKKELGNLEDYSVNNFSASPDLSVFYFRSDGDLYAKKGTAKAKRIATDVSIIGHDLSTGGIYYYVDYDYSDTNNVYYSVNGSKGKVIMKGVEDYSICVGHYLLFEKANAKNDDYSDYYIVNGKSVKKLFTTED